MNEEENESPEAGHWFYVTVLLLQAVAGVFSIVGPTALTLAGFLWLFNGGSYWRWVWWLVLIEFAFGAAIVVLWAAWLMFWGLFARLR